MKLQSDNKKKYKDLFIVIIILAILILYAYHETYFKNKRKTDVYDYNSTYIENPFDQENINP